MTQAEISIFILINSVQSHQNKIVKDIIKRV